MSLPDQIRERQAEVTQAAFLTRLWKAIRVIGRKPRATVLPFPTKDAITRAIEDGARRSKEDV